MNQQYFDVVMQGGPIPGSSLTLIQIILRHMKDCLVYQCALAAQWMFSEMIEEQNYQQLIQAMLDDICCGYCTGNVVYWFYRG